LRGNSYYKLKEYDKAISDYQQAADLFQQQGDTENYQKVLSLIENLQ
jgi:tetratricopeptide (TPR) repeat protein